MAALADARAKVQHPAQLVGFRGRDWPRSNLQQPSYIAREVSPGLHPIVLTIALAGHKATCAAFFRYAPYVEDLIADSKPYWNGEDILHALVSYKLGCIEGQILPGGWPEATATALHYFKDENDEVGCLDRLPGLVVAPCSASVTANVECLLQQMLSARAAAHAVIFCTA